MSFHAEGRLSDSGYVESIWRGQATEDRTLMCPADGRLTLRIAKLRGKVDVTVEGPLRKAVPKTHVEGIDWLVIKFKLGVYMPFIQPRKIVEDDVALTEASGRTFWMHGSAWEFPTYENADTFVKRLIRDDSVVFDPVVRRSLQNQPVDVASRTVRHRFLQVTGLSQNHIRQIEQARDALGLLEQGVPILDVVDRLTYADQPHLTRSLKRFMGYTPANIPR